jgi:signal transduction histidine kinase
VAVSAPAVEAPPRPPVDADPHAPCARLSTLDGLIVGANAAAARLLARPVAALVGRTFASCLAPSSAMLWEAQFRPLLMARGTLDGAFLSVRDAGTGELPVLVAATARREGRALHVELALLPARQRVAFEQALRTARDEAEAARLESEAARRALAESVARQQAVEAQLQQAQKMEVVGQLAGGIAHDFNNLLAVIGGHLEEATARLAPAPAPVRAAVDEELASVRRTADRAAAVVRQLLAFSRHQVLAPGRLELGAAVREAGPLLQPVLGPDVAWRVEVDPAAGPVVADRGQVEQVLLNLVLNARDAIHATGRGGTITVSVAPGHAPSVMADAAGVAPRAWVRLTVADTGTGMDAATLGRVFEPFFTTKTVGAGSGLGLAMVYGIVQQSGGQVHVASTPGVGTTVTIDLPAAPVAAPVPPPPPVSAAAGAPTAAAPTGPAPDGGAPIVLLAEDEPALRRIAQRALTRAGFTVLACEDGAAAWAAWQAHRAGIVAVVSDVRMPGMDGHALRDAIRAECASLPILLISGYAELALAVHGPADGFLEKPFTTARLVETLRALGVQPA